MILFSSFYRDIKAISVPEGLGTNVEPAFRNYVTNGLIRTQTYIPCLRSNSIDFQCQIDAKDFCNAAILDGPDGMIQQVYAFKPGKDCRKYYYEPVSTNFINCWIEEQKCTLCDATVPPANNYVYTDPYCNYVIDGDAVCNTPYLPSVPEDDSTFRLCAKRYFARGPDKKLYLAPRFPCGYVVAIHYEGIKRTYRNTDPVWQEDDIKHAVAKFAEAELALKDRDTQSWQALMITYNEMIRDINHRCRRERRLPLSTDCGSEMIDSLLPFVNPLPQNNVYDAELCLQPGDTASPYVVCPD